MTLSSIRRPWYWNRTRLRAARALRRWLWADVRELLKPGGEVLWGGRLWVDTQIGTRQDRSRQLKRTREAAERRRWATLAAGMRGLVRATEEMGAVAAQVVVQLERSMQAWARAMGGDAGVVHGRD